MNYSDPCRLPLTPTHPLPPHTLNTSLAPLSPSSSDSTTATYRNIKLIIDVYVVGTLCLFGITGNLMSAAVLGRDRSIRRTTGFLLQALALSDAVYLVTCLLYQTLNSVRDFSDWLPEPVSRSWVGFVPYTWPSASIAQTATVWLVVVVTADRYIAICKPLHSPQYSTISRARVTVVLVWLFAILYNMPRFFEREVQVVRTNFTAPIGQHFNANNTTEATCTSVKVAKSNFRNNTTYVLVYKTLLFFIVRFLAPFAALAFFNTRLILAIRHSNKIPEKITSYTSSQGMKRIHRSSSSGGATSTSLVAAGRTSLIPPPHPSMTCGGSNQPRTRPRIHSYTGSSTLVSSSGGGRSRNERYTLTLVVVVLVFVLCEIPDLLLRLWVALSQYAAVPFPRPYLVYVNIVSNLMLTVNSCINFLIYCVMGRRFRLILGRMLCSKGASRDGRNGCCSCCCNLWSFNRGRSRICDAMCKSQNPGCRRSCWKLIGRQGSRGSCQGGSDRWGFGGGCTAVTRIVLEGEDCEGLGLSLWRADYGGQRAQNGLSPIAIRRRSSLTMGTRHSVGMETVIVHMN